MGKYETLIRVAELKNITRAAQELGYSQPNISHAIHKLEDELGVSLFNRGKRSILSLTEAGTALLPMMQQAEELERAILRTAQSYQDETLRIGTFYSISAYLLPPLLKRFSAQYPTVKIALYERETYRALEEMLNEGLVDCSFYAGAFRDQFAHTPLFRDSYYVVTSLDHPLAQADAVALDALAQYPFIMPSEALGQSASMNCLRKLKISANITTHSQEDFATLNLVAQGLGISLLPGLIAQNTTRPIRAIPLQEPLSREIGIICPASRKLSKAAAAFLRVAKEYVQERGQVSPL